MRERLDSLKENETMTIVGRPKNNRFKMDF